MKNRKILSMLMLTVMLAVSGCGNVATTEDQVIEVVEENKEDETQVVENTDEVDEAEVEEDSEDESLVEEEVVETISYTAEQLDAMDSVEFASILKLGWNLGNTLDANSVGGLESETCWNQPITTQELISYIKEAGFTSIRIPVSWGKHTDADYQIDAEWMARVKEVVDYAYNADLFVIINSHHDNDYYYPSADNAANAKKYITTIWSQIAEEFKDYDNHLVFESMNEPRLSGTNIEWYFNAGDAQGRAAIEEICKLNQAFVDTVRASGGNNANRFIMVPSYAASQDFAFNTAFHMPEDPSNKLMLSVHAYTPYDFAGKGNGYSNWDGSKNSELVFMGKLNSMFIIKGYGVVIGEFGATNKDNDKDRASWARAYTTKAEGFGIPCFLWDNGSIGIGEENFGMIDRNNLKVYFPELLDAYKNAYK